MKKTRRTFLKNSGQAALGFGLLGLTSCDVDSTKKMKKEPTKKEIKEMFFKISLAQWSLHKSL